MTCKDCIHDNACSSIFRFYGGNPDYMWNRVEDTCKPFQNKANFVEVKQAEWIKISLGDFDFVKRYKCSLCENIVEPSPDIITYYRYCYNCGARMEFKGGAVIG